MIMQNIRNGRFMWLIMLVLAAGMVQAQDDYEIRVYPTPKTDTPLKIDGKLDEAAWEQAPWASGFTLFGQPGNVPAERQTAFRVMYDDTYLYFGIRCEEQEMDRVPQIKLARDEHAIFGSEAVEVFVDPNHTHSTYYQFAVNAAGSLYDSIHQDPLWNSRAVTATHMGEDAWTVELAIPWACLGAQPTPGHVVGFNVCRNSRLGQSRMWSMWAQVRGGFHDPERFAHLVLSGTPEMISRLGPEFRKGDRSGPIVVYSDEGFAAMTYSQLAVETLAELKAMIDELEAISKAEESAATRDQLQLRIADYRTRYEELAAEAEGKLDALAWTRLDTKMQDVFGEISRAVWEARLDGLLSAI